MAMFGAGGGGNFDPSNWVDHNVYNEVMNGDNGGLYHHHNKNNNKHNHINKDSKILLWISLGGFGLWFFIAGVVFSATKDSDYVIRAIFAILPYIWLISSLVIGLIVIGRKNAKKGLKNDSKTKNEESKINDK